MRGCVERLRGEGDGLLKLRSGIKLAHKIFTVKGVYIFNFEFLY